MRTDLVEGLPALFAYVQSGGNVIEQYNTPNGLRTNTLAPFDLELSRNLPNNRVTDENAPITLLAPDHPAFNTPNKIVPADFDGWVQARPEFPVAMGYPAFHCPAGVQRHRRGPAAKRVAGRPLWQRLFRLHGPQFLPPASRRRARGVSTHGQPDLVGEMMAVDDDQTSLPGLRHLAGCLLDRHHHFHPLRRADGGVPEVVRMNHLDYIVLLGSMSASPSTEFGACAAAAI